MSREDIRKTTTIQGTVESIEFTYRCRGKMIKKAVPWACIELSEEFEARIEDCDCGRIHVVEL